MWQCQWVGKNCYQTQFSNSGWMRNQIRFDDLSGRPTVLHQLTSIYYLNKGVILQLNSQMPCMFSIRIERRSQVNLRCVLVAYVKVGQQRGTKSTVKSRSLKPSLQIICNFYREFREREIDCEMICHLVN